MILIARLKYSLNNWLMPFVDFIVHNPFNQSYDIRKSSKNNDNRGPYNGACHVARYGFNKFVHALNIASKIIFLKKCSHYQLESLLFPTLQASQR